MTSPPGKVLKSSAGGQGRLPGGGILSLALKVSPRHRDERCRRAEVSSEIPRILLFLEQETHAAVTEDKAGPGNEGPGRHTLEHGCCSKGGGKPLRGLTGGNRVQIWLDLQITLATSVKDELEVHSGEKDRLEIVEA